MLMHSPILNSSQTKTLITWPIVTAFEKYLALPIRSGNNSPRATAFEDPLSKAPLQYWTYHP